MDISRLMKVIITIVFFPHGGANVDMPSQNNEDTPLHTAARFGIAELIALYLAHGASVNAANSLQETPLMTACFWAFDSKEQTYSQDHHLVCRLLLDHQAGEFFGTFVLILTLCTIPWNALSFVFYNIFLPSKIPTSEKRTIKRLFTRQPGTVTTS